MQNERSKYKYKIALKTAHGIDVWLVCLLRSGVIVASSKFLSEHQARIWAQREFHKRLNEQETAC